MIRPSDDTPIAPTDCPTCGRHVTGSVSPLDEHGQCRYRALAIEDNRLAHLARLLDKEATR